MVLVRVSENPRLAATPSCEYPRLAWTVVETAAAREMVQVLPADAAHRATGRVKSTAGDDVVSTITLYDVTNVTGAAPSGLSRATADVCATTTAMAATLITTAVRTFMLGRPISPRHSWIEGKAGCLYINQTYDTVQGRSGGATGASR